jgi:hypothetical protein
MLAAFFLAKAALVFSEILIKSWAAMVANSETMTSPNGPRLLEVGLGVELIIHPVVFELLQVAERSQGPFAAETVQAPEHHQVKLLLIGCEQQLLEGGAVGLATGLLIGVHLTHGAMLLGKRAELVELILGVLPFVFGRHAGVDGNACITF